MTENTQHADTKVWLVTGAGRGSGVYIARAALAAGHSVVATARRAESITRAARSRCLKRYVAHELYRRLEHGRSPA